LHTSEYDVLSVGVTVVLPDIWFPQLKPFEAHVVAPVTFQERVALPPEATVPGLDVRVTDTSRTVTAADAVADCV